MRWLDDVSTDRREMGINEWRDRAREREAWRRIVKGAKAHPGGCSVIEEEEEEEVFSCALLFISTPCCLTHEVSWRPELCPCPQPSNTVYDPITYRFIIFFILSHFLCPGLQYTLFHSVLSTNATSSAHLMILGFISHITFGNQYNHAAPYYTIVSSAMLVSLPRVLIFSACFVDIAVCTELIRCCNTNISLNYKRPSPYRAVNTPSQL